MVNEKEKSSVKSTEFLPTERNCDSTEAISAN